MDKGKKLADLMYGQRMDEGGAAFGVFPQMKPRRSKQDPEAAKDVPRQLLRGWAAGTLGLPGDIEGLIRMLPGLDETPRLPTSEFYLDYLPGKAQGPAGEAAAGMGTLFGGLGSTKVARGALKAGEAAGKAGRAALETVGTGPSPGGLAAQRGAVKVPGAPKPKTPYERSLEQGYEHGWYHGTTGDIKSFDPKLRGETTGARSAQKGFFFVRDPQNPPESMRVKSSDPQSIEMMRKLGYSDEEIAKMNQMSFEGNAAETASQYAKIGGSRAYKEAMRKANAAEKRGDWSEYEKQMQIAEDEAIGLQHGLQDLTSKYGEARDVMLDKLEKTIYDRPLPQDQAEALDEWRKANMPYGWYNQFSAEQFGNLEKKLVDKFGEEKVEPLLNAIKDFRSVANERALLENTQEGSNVMPVALRYKKPYVHDYQGSPYRDESYADLIDKALTEGYDSLLLKNTFDPGGGPGKLVDVGVVFDPAQIRSRFAKFNPEDIQSPDITKAEGGAVRFTNNPDAMRLELQMAGGGLAKGMAKLIKRAAESAGQKAPVVAEKDLTTLQDVHTTLGDKVNARVAEAQKMMEGFEYQYDKGQRVFTKDSAGKNKPPYTILNRTRVGNQVMREDHPELGPGMGKVIIDPQTGKAMRTPYEPGYRVRMERGPDDWTEFEIPQKAIVGDVEMAAGGAVTGGITADDLIIEERPL